MSANLCFFSMGAPRGNFSVTLYTFELYRTFNSSFIISGCLGLFLSKSSVAYSLRAEAQIISSVNDTVQLLSGSHVRTLAVFQSTWINLLPGTLHRDVFFFVKGKTSNISALNHT